MLLLLHIISIKHEKDITFANRPDLIHLCSDYTGIASLLPVGSPSLIHSFNHHGIPGPPQVYLVIGSRHCLVSSRNVA